MQLAQVTHARHVGDVGAEGDPPGPGAPRESQAPRHDRLQSVRPHDDARFTRFPLPVSRSRDDPRYGPVVHHEILDRDPLPHDRPRARGRLDQDGVELRAGEREAVRPRRRVAVVGGEPSAHGGAARGDHLHPVEPRRRGALDAGEHAPSQPREQSGRFRAQVLRTGLVPGEAGAVEQDHAGAGAGEVQRGGRARRAGADHDRIPRRHGRMSIVPAPTSVAARLTTSLSSQRQPLTRRTGS